MFIFNGRAFFTHLLFPFGEQKNNLIGFQKTSHYFSLIQKWSNERRPLTSP
ncbi:hypothetical protein HMPREF0511_0163 [Limosilactobacillus fermentum ATCC 14931]|nr:hypothetical protein HMPREF0511_0163 [Limosilactobacillus fermentum ATCC 14931]